MNIERLKKHSRDVLCAFLSKDQDADFVLGVLKDLLTEYPEEMRVRLVEGYLQDCLKANYGIIHRPKLAISHQEILKVVRELYKTRVLSMNTLLSSFIALDELEIASYQIETASKEVEVFEVLERPKRGRKSRKSPEEKRRRYQRKKQRKLAKRRRKRGR